MELERNERQELHTALIKALITYDDFRLFCDLHLNRNIAIVSSEKRIDLVALDLIKTFEAEGPLEVLITELILFRPEHDLVRTTCIKLLQRWHIPLPVADTTTQLNSNDGDNIGCPTNSMILDNHSAFLDRAAVRDAVRSLVKTNGPKFLVVNGPKNCGKSYIQNYLIYLRKRKWLEVEYPTVNSASTINASREAAVADIIADIGCDMAFIGHQDDEPPPKKPAYSLERYGKIVARWFCYTMKRRRESTYWIVLDGFDEPLLDEAICNFIGEVACLVHRDLHHVRLVLLGYSRGLPRALRHLIKVCEIDPLSMDDVREFLRRVGQYLHDGDVESFVEQWVVRITAEVPAYHPNRCELIADWCQKIASAYNVPIGL